MMLRTGPTRKVRRAKARNKGFTLIELLIVCAIILTLVAFSTPLFRKTFTDLELRETASNLSKFITFAQQRAVIDGAVYKIVFNFDGKNYRLAASAGPARKTAYVKSKDGFGRAFNIPGSVDIEGTAQEILFYPDGHSDAVELKLRSINDRTLKITVTGLLGSAVITEENR